MASLLPTSSFQSPISGTDSLSTLYQILSLLSLHYLTLSVFTPPFLSALSSAPASTLTFDSPLNFEGGAAQVGMVLDWREVSSRTTFDWSPLGEDFLSWRKGLSKEQLLEGLDEGDRIVAEHWKMGSVWLGDVAGAGGPPPVLIDAPRVIREGSSAAARQATSGETAQEIQDELGSTGGSEAESDLQQWEWKSTRDPWRGWAIAMAWALACAVDVFLLTTIIRRPKHILDHVFTLHLLNLLLTSWYTSSIPTSLFWWGVMLLHGVCCVLWSERVAIGREMNVSVGEGLVGSGRARAGEDASADGSGEARAAEQGEAGAPHVLFDEAEDAEGDEAEETDRMLKKPTMGTAGAGRSSPFGGRGSGRQAPAAGARGQEGEGELIEMEKLRSPAPAI